VVIIGRTSFLHTGFFSFNDAGINISTPDPSRGICLVPLEGLGVEKYLLISISLPMPLRFYQGILTYPCN